MDAEISWRAGTGLCGQRPHVRRSAGILYRVRRYTRCSHAFLSRGATLLSYGFCVNHYHTTTNLEAPDYCGPIIQKLCSMGQWW